MYEKLDKLRAEVERCKSKIEDDKAKLRVAQEKLEKAEDEHRGALRELPQLHRKALHEGLPAKPLHPRAHRADIRYDALNAEA